MSWREDYMTALAERSSCERKDYDLIDAYTRLADRTAALEAQQAGRADQISSSPRNENTPKHLVAENASSHTSTQLRIDLAEALRSRGQIQSRLKIAEDELEKARIKMKADAKLTRELTSERNVLAAKVKDRDEELKGKAKLLEEVQDEMISLTLQVNVSERKAKELKNENKDLIDRWMARMGQEAEAMNNASRFS